MTVLNAAARRGGDDPLFVQSEFHSCFMLPIILMPASSATKCIRKRISNVEQGISNDEVKSFKSQKLNSYYLLQTPYFLLCSRPSSMIFAKVCSRRSTPANPPPGPKRLRDKAFHGICCRCGS